MLMGPNIEEQIREEERLRQEEEQRRQAAEAEAARKREEEAAKRRKAEREAEDRRAAEEEESRRQAEKKRQDDENFRLFLKVGGGILLGLAAMVGLIVLIVACTRPGACDATGGQNPAPTTTPAPQKRTEAAAPAPYTVSAPTHAPAPQWDDRREDRASVKTPCAAAREEKQQVPEPKKAPPEARPYTPPPRSVPTTIEVHMPADADLYANGVLMPRQRGLSDRQFVTPACPEGSDQKYYFTVRDRDGRTQQQVVGFQAGESKSVDLSGDLVRPPPIPYRP